MKKRVLVTGGAGFIGSHVAEHCLRLGWDVVAVDDLSGGFFENVPTGVQWLQGDVVNPSFVESLWQNGRFDYVYHLAAYAAEGLSHFVRHYNYTVNLLASINLINQAVKYEVECFVFTSSIAVYGRNQVPMREEFEPRPEDPYGISKYAVELDLKAAHEMFGLNYSIFRPHNVYGERQNIADNYRNVIGIFLNQSMRGEPMSIFGDGTQTRAFTYIDDVAPLIARAPTIPAAVNEVFNIGADVPYSVEELAKEVAKALGVTPRVTYLPPRNEVAHAFSDHSKLRRVFQPPQATTLHDGIRRMAEWVKCRGPCQRTVFSTLELQKNLPASWSAKDARF